MNGTRALTNGTHTHAGQAGARAMRAAVRADGDGGEDGGEGGGARPRRARRAAPHRARRADLEHDDVEEDDGVVQQLQEDVVVHERDAEDEARREHVGGAQRQRQQHQRLLEHLVRHVAQDELFAQQREKHVGEQVARRVDAVVDGRKSGAHVAEGAGPRDHVAREHGERGSSSGSATRRSILPALSQNRVREW
jgi:hypothetical protein